MNEQTGEAAPRSWDETSAAAWDKWFHIIEGGARALSDRMIELAAIGPGARVLDVASGLGGADRGYPSLRDAGGNGAAGQRRLLRVGAELNRERPPAMGQVFPVRRNT